MTQPKKIQKRKRKKNSPFTKLLLCLFVFAIMLTTLITLSITVFFNIKSVSVSGETKYSKQEILEVANIRLGSNMNLLETDEIEVDICQKLPYIGKAKIVRKYPDSVVIKVTPCEPDSVYKTPKGYALTYDRKVLSEVKKRPKDLPLVAANIKNYRIGADIELSDNAEEVIKKVTAAAEKARIKGVTSINIQNISDITVTCDDSIVLQLGTTESIDKKFNNAIKIIETQRKKYGSAVEGYVNLKYLTTDSNRSYFTRKSITHDDEIRYEEPQSKK